MKDKPSPLLVVDDEENNRDLLSRRLRRAGYDVEAAAGGEEALGLIQGKEYELVLLDSMMPNMSGLDLLRLLRGTYSPSELPVIMVTAVSDSSHIVEALGEGANDYITKPVDFTVALARIHSQLNRKRAEAALRESEERYSLASRGTNDGLWDWDLRTGKLFYSARWKEMLGYDDGELSDSAEEWLSRLHRDDIERFRQELAEHWKSGGADEFQSEYRIQNRQGGYRWMLSRGMILRSKDGVAVRMAGSQTDVTRSKAFDALTGLPNRTLFAETLRRWIDCCKAKSQESFAVVFMDLDRFKHINDSLGHVAGDHLLVEVSRRLARVLRTNPTPGVNEDVVARLGGDEFAALLHNVSTVENAASIAGRIQREIDMPIPLEGRDVFTSCSIGIALWREDYETPTDMLRDADTAMYRAKAEGRARYAIFDSQMREKAVRRLELETDLKVAIVQNQFAVCFQPKIRLDDDKLVGFEALLRWFHPTKGLVMPGEFIPIAEETGMIVEIGEWILRHACATMQRWHIDHPNEPPLEISVNLSPRQFRDPELLNRVSMILEQTGLAAKYLQLEITEAVLIEDSSSAVDVLNKLREMGVGLKIDDFGTGYSSLSYLTQLPFDSLKIDRSFVFGMCKDPHSLEIIRTVIALAANLGLHVVAEGIETKEQMQELKSLGCEFGQGYYFAKPLAEDVAEDLLNGASVIADLRPEKC